MTSYCLVSNDVILLSAQTDHVLLVGAGTNQFADELGFERVSNNVTLFRSDRPRFIGGCWRESV